MPVVGSAPSISINHAVEGVIVQRTIEHTRDALSSQIEASSSLAALLSRYGRPGQPQSPDREVRRILQETLRNNEALIQEARRFPLSSELNSQVAGLEALNQQLATSQSSIPIPAVVPSDAMAQAAILAHLQVIEEFMRLSNPAALAQASQNVRAGNEVRERVPARGSVSAPPANTISIGAEGSVARSQRPSAPQRPPVLSIGERARQSIRNFFYPPVIIHAANGSFAFPRSSISVRHIIGTAIYRLRGGSIDFPQAHAYNPAQDAAAAPPSDAVSAPNSHREIEVIERDLAAQIRDTTMRLEQIRGSARAPLMSEFQDELEYNIDLIAESRRISSPTAEISSQIERLDALNTELGNSIRRDRSVPSPSDDVSSPLIEEASDAPRSSQEILADLRSQIETCAPVADLISQYGQPGQPATPSHEIALEVQAQFDVNARLITEARRIASPSEELVSEITRLETLNGRLRIAEQPCPNLGFCASCARYLGYLDQVPAQSSASAIDPADDSQMENLLSHEGDLFRGRDAQTLAECIRQNIDAGGLFNRSIAIYESRRTVIPFRVGSRARETIRTNRALLEEVRSHSEGASALLSGLASQLTRVNEQLQAGIDRVGVEPPPSVN